MQTKVQETSVNLKKRLDKEIERIKGHYAHQSSEVETIIKRYQDQILTLQKQLAKTEIKDPLSLAKIEKLNESIKTLNDSEKKQIWEKEEKFFINDETHKHTLNINNKIINTTIIYYPIFDFTVFLKSKESARQFNLTYNPMLDTLTEIQCDVCKRPTVEISICSSGHINCQNCIDKCRSCYSSLCSNCLKKECDACGIKLCKKCSVKCNKCFKFFCKNHLRQDYVSGKDYCTNCIKRCMSCNQFTTAINMKPGTEICKKCATLSILKGKP